MAKKRIGQVWHRKDGEGMFIKLGSENQSSEQYNLDVEVIVRDPKTGEVLAQEVNGILSLYEPKSTLSSLAHDVLINLPDDETAEVKGSGRQATPTTSARPSSQGSSQGTRSSFRK